MVHNFLYGVSNGTIKVLTNDNQGIKCSIRLVAMVEPALGRTFFRGNGDITGNHDRHRSASLT